MTLSTTLPRALALGLLSGVASAQVQITEYLYSGLDGEFIELTNVGANAVDLTGWSLDDQSAVPGAFDLSGAGMLAPGASLVVTDRLEANFVVAWGLSGVTVLGGNALALIGRNDSIYVFDALGATVDVLNYGDEDFPGTHRAQGASAHVCNAALGIDDPYRWTGAEAGDPWMSSASVNGDVGSPGVYVPVACPPIGSEYCVGAGNSTGLPAYIEVSGSRSIMSNDVLLECFDMPLNSVGFFLASTTQDLINNPGGSSGNLCLGGSIGRYSSFAQSSMSTGSIDLGIDLSAMAQPTGPAQVMPGETWNFQCWFRDSVLGFPTSNFSGAVQVTFY